MVRGRVIAMWQWFAGRWSGFWSAWRAGQGEARRAGSVAAGLAVATAAVAVVLAEVVDALWVPALLPAVIAVPGLYLMYKAVPGAARSHDVGQSAALASVPLAGRLVAEWSASELGVHAVVGGGPQPPYLLRPHDQVLRAVLDPVAGSRLVVVVGGSSTGKTRSAFEAVRAVLPGWWLDYPLDVAALARRLDAGVPDRTVLWLGELRQYADADGGDQVLGRLADLLGGPGRILITTIWPETAAAYLQAAENRQTLTEDQRAAGLSGRTAAATAGRLLRRVPDLTGMVEMDPARGGLVVVPDTFTQDDLQAAAATENPVLAEAVAAAGAARQPGHIAQYLAGAPALLERWLGPGGDRYGQAIITAAIDATRLGHASPLPLGLLLDAAAGYLADTDRTADVAGWGRRAVEWASAELRGAVRALIPVPPASGTGITGYTVADYLDQQGRAKRAAQLGPASLWDALTADTTAEADLDRLGSSAEARGLYRHAAQFWTAAVSRYGSADAAIGLLVSEIEFVGVTAAHWAVRRVSISDPWTVESLMHVLAWMGQGEAAGILAGRAAPVVPLEDPKAIGELVRDLAEAGQGEAVAVLAGRAAPVVPLEDPKAIGGLVHALTVAGQGEAAGVVLAGRATDVTFANPKAVGELVRALAEAGHAKAARVLASRAAKVTFANPKAVGELVRALARAGQGEAAGMLAGRAAPVIPLKDPEVATDLVRALTRAGQGEAAAALAGRAAAGVSLEDPEAVGDLVRA